MRRASLVLLFALFVLGITACRAATQLQVEAYTNLGYEPSARLAFFSGRDLSNLSAEPSGVPSVQWGQDGRLGSLAFVPPSGNPRARVAVRTVLAFGRDPITCSAADAKGCIVADRQLAYDQGRSLRVPVGLFRQCLGVVCPLGRTCNYEGNCVSADLDVSQCSSESGCSIVGDPPSPPGVQASGLPAADAGDAQVPSSQVPLPPVLSMRDRDPRQGFVDGTLSAAAAPGSFAVSWVELSYPTPDGTPGTPFATLPQLPSTFTFLGGQALPVGVSDVMGVAVSVGPSGRARSEPTRLRIDNHPRVLDIGADLGSDVAGVPTYFPDASSPGTTLLVFGVDGSRRPTLRRCNLDGSQCVGTLLSKVAGTPLQAAVSLPVSGIGALVVAYDDGRLLRCTANGTSCDSSARYDAGEPPSGGRSVLAAFRDPLAPNGYVIVRAVNDAGGAKSTFALDVFRCVGVACTKTRSQLLGRVPAQRVASGPAASYLVAHRKDRSELVRCDANTGVCTTRQVLPSSFHAAAVALQGGAVPFVLGRVVTSPALLDCQGDPCVSRPLPGVLGPTQEFASWTPSLAFDGTTPVVIYGNRDFKPTAARCPAAASCDITDLSPFAVPNFRAALPSLLVDAQGRLVVGAANNDLAPAMVRCSLAFDVCSGASNQSPELVGNTVGDALDATVDPLGKRLLVVTENPSRGVQPTLFSCDLGATSCAARDVSVEGLPGSGFAPSLVFDVNKQKLAFVVDDRSVEREVPASASLVTCDATGKNCASRTLFPPILTDDVTDFVSDGTNTAVRTQAGRLRIFHQDMYGSFDHEVLDCLGDGSACSHRSLPIQGFPLSNLAYDPVSDRSYLAPPYEASAPYAYSCLTAPQVPDEEMCREFIVLDDPAFFFAQIIASTVEAGVPTFLLSYRREEDFSRALALVRCPNEECGSPEPLDVTGIPDFGFFPRSSMVLDAARGARYIALGDQDSGALSLDRCTASGCSRLYSFPFESTPPYKLLLDPATDRLFLAFRDDSNRGRPAVLTLDLF